jgi:hypothetical protein
MNNIKKGILIGLTALVGYGCQPKQDTTSVPIPISIDGKSYVGTLTYDKKKFDADSMYNTIGTISVNSTELARVYVVVDGKHNSENFTHNKPYFEEFKQK